LNLFSEINQALKELGDPERALQMEKYTRHRFSYFGLNAGTRLQAFKVLKPKIKALSHPEYLALMQALWDGDKRELQYFAIDMGKWQKKRFTPADLPILETLLMNKSWWDSIDLLSTNVISEIGKQFPFDFEPYRLKWINSDHMWLNRTTIIYQLKYGKETNLEKLEEAILPHLRSPEFFHQKAIGWSLRQYTRVNPDWVQNFVERHEIVGLARREALRLIKA
jgi:3-methyladenine DNA glycosylase AlkD